MKDKYFQNSQPRDSQWVLLHTLKKPSQSCTVKKIQNFTLNKIERFKILKYNNMH